MSLQVFPDPVDNPVQLLDFLLAAESSFSEVATATSDGCRPGNGDEAICWTLYQRAKPYLEQAKDYYGWSKSLFFLSLFRFWQGQLDEAKTQIVQAREMVTNITQQPRDFWWLVRDGTYYLGSHWWDIITSSQLLDVLLCSGQSGGVNFDIEFLRYQQAYSVASWTRDFPPFSPRYL